MLDWIPLVLYVLLFCSVPLAGVWAASRRLRLPWRVYWALAAAGYFVVLGFLESGNGRGGDYDPRVPLLPLTLIANFATAALAVLPGAALYAAIGDGGVDPTATSVPGTPSSARGQSSPSGSRPPRATGRCAGLINEDQLAAAIAEHLRRTSRQ